MKTTWVAAILTLTFSVHADASGKDTIWFAQGAPSSWWPSFATPTPPPTPENIQAQATAPTPPPTAQRTEFVKFDNWTVTCMDFSEGPKKRTCAAQLLVQKSDTNQTLLAWTVSINDKKQFVTLLQIPTGVLILPGIELQLNGVSKRTIPYESCEAGRCSAAIVMDASMMRDVTAAAKAKIVIHTVNGQSLQFDIPIKGFDKASAQVKSAL